jgi:dienelactone hydrolase
VIAALISGCSSSGSTVSPAAPTTPATSSAVTPTTAVARTTTTTTTRPAGITTTTATVAPTTYAVGQHSVDLVDTSRPTPANGTFPGAPTRPLPTLLLYPAAGDPSAPLAEDAPPAEAAYGFPVIIYAHGNNGSPELSLPMLTRLAAAGFVVAAPAFPLSKRDAPGGHTSADYRQQPADMRFVLDNVLAGRVGPVPAVDGGRVAVVGHSLGAITVLGLTQNSCCHDDRIKAAVAISGTQAQWDGKSYQPPTTPLLLIHGDHDDVVPFTGSTEVFAAAPSPVGLVRLIDGPHTLYGPPWLDVVAATTIDFLRAELDDDASAEAALAVDGNQPGLATFQQR